MEANDYQVGGEHYKSEYQHWDFVCDTDLHYILGCATKYIARWRKKNGIQDLHKASHYISKAEEEEIYVMEREENLFLKMLKRLFSVECKFTPTYVLWERFCEPMELADRAIMDCVINKDYKLAQSLISDLIEREETSEADQNYVDPDNNYFRG